MISQQKKRIKSDNLKNTGNTGHFCKNTGFYRTSKKIQDITENTGQVRGLLLQLSNFCQHVNICTNLEKRCYKLMSTLIEEHIDLGKHCTHNATSSISNVMSNNNPAYHFAIAYDLSKKPPICKQGRLSLMSDEREISALYQTKYAKT